MKEKIERDGRFEVRLIKSGRERKSARGRERDAKRERQGWEGGRVEGKSPNPVHPCVEVTAPATPP